MARSRTRRERRRRSRKRCRRLVSLCITRDGRVRTTAVDVPYADYERYLERHALLPEDIKRWSEAQLRDELQIARVTGAERDWERVLMLLAHHQSKLACDLLRELGSEVPAALQGFQQLALGEALGWLGYDYISDGQGRPRVLPAGAPWPAAAPN